jgi:hypothetical protein
MRTMVWGLAVCAGLMALAWLPLTETKRAFGQKSLTADSLAESDGLIALNFAISDKLQQVTVIDPRQQVMSVYHIEAATGAIELKSVRKIEWDLRMVEFNGAKPLPLEIRSHLERNK